MSCILFESRLNFHKKIEVIEKVIYKNTNTKTVNGFKSNLTDHYYAITNILLILLIFLKLQAKRVNEKTSTLKKFEKHLDTDDLTRNKSCTFNETLICYLDVMDLSNRVQIWSYVHFVNSQRIYLFRGHFLESHSYATFFFN